MNNRLLLALLITVTIQVNAQIASLVEHTAQTYCTNLSGILQDLKEGKLNSDIQDILKKTLMYNYISYFPLSTSQLFLCTTSIELLAFSPEGKDMMIIPTADALNRVYMISLSDFVTHAVHTPLKVLEHDFPVSKAIFSPDGEYILTHGPGHLYIWHVVQACTLQTAFHHNDIQSATFSPDGRFLLILYGKKVCLTPVTSPQAPLIVLDYTALLSGEPHSLTAVAYSPDARYIVAGSSNGTLYLWDITNPQQSPKILGDDGHFTTLSVLLLGHHSAITAITFSPDNRHVLTEAEDMTARFWDITRPEAAPRILFSKKYPLRTAALSYCGNYALTTELTNEAYLWNLHNHTVLPLVLESNHGNIHRALFSPDRRHIITVSTTDTHKSILHFWDLATWDKHTLEDVVKKIIYINTLKSNTQLRYLLHKK